MSATPQPSAKILELREELERLTASFNAIAGASGKITVPAFQQALELRSEFVARHLFRQFDTNGNGVIDRDEFLAAIERLLTGSAHDKLQFLFRVHDQDQDGTIIRIELERLIHIGLAESAVTLPESLINEMIDALFEASDKNRDGLIQYEEFASVFGGYPELLERVTRADSVWRVLKNHPEPPPAPALPRLQRAANWIEEHGIELVLLLVYVLINLALFSGALLRYRAAGANGFVQLARGCGACLNFNGALILIPMLRRFLSWIRAQRFGRLLPVDHSISFHKLVGHVLFGLAVVHTLAHFGNYLVSPVPFFELLLFTRPGWTGLALMVLLWAMWTFALEPIRRAGHFELFHYVHLGYWPFFVLLLLHGPVYWMWAVVPLLGYLVERLLRMEQRAKKVELDTELLPSRVTKLSFKAPQGWEHRAGDYLFIKIPELARGEWHPFTISSAPERIGRMPDEMTLHVRSLGNWTNALYELARIRGKSDPAKLPPLVARLDGPYGTPSADIFAVKHAVLIGAGIGVTPFAAILESMLLRRQAGGGELQLEHVHFIWINRDQYSFEWFTELLASLERSDTDGMFDIHIYMTGGREHLDAAALELAREVFYAKTHRDVLTGLAAKTKFGRPDWDELLHAILRQHAPERVEVFMCGPMPLVRELGPLCERLGMAFHHEVF
jgi:predicted ferric reductase/Ca2+-binding EF-hand superfamily protein